MDLQLDGVDIVAEGRLGTHVSEQQTHKYYDNEAKGHLGDAAILIDFKNDVRLGTGHMKRVKKALLPFWTEIRNIHGRPRSAQLQKILASLAADDANIPRRQRKFFLTVQHYLINDLGSLPSETGNALFDMSRNLMNTVIDFTDEKEETETIPVPEEKEEEEEEAPLPSRPGRGKTKFKLTAAEQTDLDEIKSDWRQMDFSHPKTYEHTKKLLQKLEDTFREVADAPDSREYFVAKQNLDTFRNLYYHYHQIGVSDWVRSSTTVMPQAFLMSPASNPFLSESEAASMEQLLNVAYAKGKDSNKYKTLRHHFIRKLNASNMVWKGYNDAKTLQDQKKESLKRRKNEAADAAAEEELAQDSGGKPNPRKKPRTRQDNRIPDHPLADDVPLSSPAALPVVPASIIAPPDPESKYSKKRKPEKIPESKYSKKKKTKKNIPPVDIPTDVDENVPDIIPTSTRPPSKKRKRTVIPLVDTDEDKTDVDENAPDIIPTSARPRVSIPETKNRATTLADTRTGQPAVVRNRADLVAAAAENLRLRRLEDKKADEDEEANQAPPPYDQDLDQQQQQQAPPDQSGLDHKHQVTLDQKQKLAEVNRKLRQKMIDDFRRARDEGPPPDLSGLGPMSQVTLDQKLAEVNRKIRQRVRDDGPPDDEGDGDGGGGNGGDDDDGKGPGTRRQQILAEGVRQIACSEDPRVIAIRTLLGCAPNEVKIQPAAILLDQVRNQLHGAEEDNLPPGVEEEKKEEKEEKEEKEKKDGKEEEGKLLDLLMQSPPIIGLEEKEDMKEEKLRTFADLMGDPNLLRPEDPNMLHIPEPEQSIWQPVPFDGPFEGPARPDNWRKLRGKKPSPKLAELHFQANLILQSYLSRGGRPSRHERRKAKGALDTLLVQSSKGKPTQAIRDLINSYRVQII